MPLPFQAKVKSRIPRFIDRCGKMQEALETAGNEAEHLVGGEFTSRLSSRHGQTPGQKKRIPGSPIRSVGEMMKVDPMSKLISVDGTDDSAYLTPCILPFADGIERVNVTELICGMQFHPHSGFPEFLLRLDDIRV